jgi:hypothetical protein
MSRQHLPILKYSGKQTAAFWDAAAVERAQDSGSSDAAPGIFSDWPLNGDPIPPHISPWDVIYLDGRLAPGPCRLDGGRHVGIDIQRIIGQLVPDAAILNYDPVPFTLTLTLWHPDQFVELQALIARILPKPSMNTVLRAVQVSHPNFDMYGIHTVFFQYGSLLRHLGKGITEVDFQCYEFNPDIFTDPSLAQQTQPPGEASTPAPSAVTPPSKGGGLGPG